MTVTPQQYPSLYTTAATHWRVEVQSRWFNLCLCDGEWSGTTALERAGHALLVEVSISAERALELARRCDVRFPYPGFPRAVDAATPVAEAA